MAGLSKSHPDDVDKVSDPNNNCVGATFYGFVNVVLRVQVTL